MAGAIDKKKNDVTVALNGAPKTHVDARASILANIALSREFSETFLDALCKPLTGGKNTSGALETMSLGKVCEELAAQRLVCRGHGSIKGSADGIRKFSLPPVSGSGTISGALGLSEPNTSFFGIKATDIGETYSISLNNTSGTTQTQGSNTFSVYVGDYYLVRSRVSGELIDISDDVDPYSKPGSDTDFGNAVTWVTGTGGDVSEELEANTWNYNWATANIASITLNNSGAYNELTTLRLSSALTQGSNTDYTPLGPSFGQKFYLKRQADHVNTFTITGTTSVNSVSITDVSEADLAKVKYGDIISGTGIPDDTVTIAAVQTEKNAVRLSETGLATLDGTVTLTVNSVPFGYAKDDIFCQVEVVAEGLVTNDNWKPVGDDAGDYNVANAGPNTAGGPDELLVASTAEFIGMLGFFNPNSTSNPDGSSNDITKGASNKFNSDGKEVATANRLVTNYPYIISNPFFPSNQGTSKGFEVKDGEIVGTQPGNTAGAGNQILGNKDIWSGRFVRFDYDRADAVGALPEFRYIINNAEKFYYRPNAQMSVATMGTATSIAAEAMPRGLGSDKEPRSELPTTGISDVVSIVRGNQSLAASQNSTTNWTIPLDDALHADPSSPRAGTGSAAGPTSYFYRLTNGIVRKHSWVTTWTDCANGTHEQQSTDFGLTVDYPIVSNYIAMKLTTNGTTANVDVAFITSLIDELQGTSAGGAKFRDPVMEAADSKYMTSLSATDDRFDSYICATNGTNEVDTALADVKEALADFYTASGMASDGSGRVNKEQLTGTPPWHAVNLGAAVNCAVATTTSFGSSVNVHAKWVAFSTSCGTLVTKLNERIAEIDARIGKPAYSGNPAAAGNHPAVYVSDIPSSNTTGGLAPYGRSIYNACNYLLGQDIDLLGKIIKDIEALTDLVDLVKSDRNKYEIFSGRDKIYT